jgi:tetratricopeptide (TPR) repeat protein
MTGPILTEVREAADSISDQLVGSDAGRDAVWQVGGRQTSGKTSCLHEIADRLSDTNLVPVFLSPPSRQRDSGPAALIDLGVGLRAAESLNGELQDWVESRAPWAERIAGVQTWLVDRAESLVLLCDEPLSWEAGTDETGFFSGRAEDAARLFVEQTTCRRVVAGSLPQNVVARDRVRLTAGVPDLQWLRDGDEWGALADVAGELADRAAQLGSFTALEIRLLIAEAVLFGLDAVDAMLEEPVERRRIAQEFASKCSERTELRPLWSAWLFLSELRRPFEERLLGVVGSNDIPEKQSEVLRHCLLFGNGTLRLHNVLRTEARKWRREHRDEEHELPAIARRLFGYYHDEFESRSAADDPSALVSSVEAFHFASISGESQLIEQATPYFTEQLDALGWSLSYIHRRFNEAADVFRAALDWDETDDYAHHYLAFNLDRVARDPREIEEHYLRALEINPNRVWWHSRLITFLVHRGRMGDAHVRWDDAQVALGVDSRDGDSFLFETLHVWVAKALLDRAELAFTREVLRDIPATVRGEIPGLREMFQRLTRLEEAAEFGAFMPADRLKPRWWERRPELLQDRLGTGEQLMSWLAARIEGLDEQGVHFHAAVIERGDTADAPRTARTTLRRDEFNRLCRDGELADLIEPGWFAEIGIYAHPEAPEEGAHTLIRLHEPEWDEGDAPFLDTARYVRPHVTT